MFMLDLEPFDMPAPIVYDTKTAQSDWVVYIHKVDDIAVFVGYCKLVEIFHSPDARRNIEWLKNAAGRKITLQIIGKTGDRIKAHNEAHKMITQFRPLWNVHGSRLGKGEKVKCIESGDEYENATAAARYYGCALSTMSNHLNRRQGYEKINGHFTFERIL